jgi:hypothetical protein
VWKNSYSLVREGRKLGWKVTELQAEDLVVIYCKYVGYKDVIELR